MRKQKLNWDGYDELDEGEKDSNPKDLINHSLKTNRITERTRVRRNNS
jgi:hypothetical protein